MSNDYILECSIDPRKGKLSVKGIITIPAPPRSALFILNRGLRWTKTVRRTAMGNITLEVYKRDDIEVPKFYNGDLWVFQIDEPDLDEIVIEVEYSGQIHPPSKESGMPVMGYIKKDFVELACYCAWYPVPFNMETHLFFDVTLKGPNDWTWKANGTYKKLRIAEDSNIWKFKQTSLVNDITLVGLPERNAHLDPESLFWGPKEMIGSQKILDTDARKMLELLEEWLGPRGTENPVKFVITPRTKGGAYARSGLIVVGGGYATDIKLRPQVLQAMCHEICHDWFCKASVKNFDNWVDESLAEYCSIIVTDEYLNNNFLEWRLSLTKENLEKQGYVHSIKSLTRDQDESHVAYLFRGFLLLHEISEKIGRNLFRDIIGEFARLSVKSDTVTSEMFLDFIEEKSGKKIYETANLWLYFEGIGIP